MQVSAVGFPQAVDADLEFGVASATPTCTWGRLSAISDSGAIAAADYTGGRLGVGADGNPVDKALQGVTKLGPMRAAAGAQPADDLLLVLVLLLQNDAIQLHEPPASTRAKPS